MYYGCLKSQTTLGYWSPDNTLFYFLFLTINTKRHIFRTWYLLICHILCSLICILIIYNRTNYIRPKLFWVCNTQWCNETLYVYIADDICNAHILFLFISINYEWNYLQVQNIILNISWQRFTSELFEIDSRHYVIKNQTFSFWTRKHSSNKNYGI